MGYRFFNPNPKQLIVGDCVIRAMSCLLEEDWDTAYARVSLQGFKIKDMPSSNSVWSECLLENKFEPVMTICQFANPPCTVRSFSEDHPKGRFLLFIGGSAGGHVVTVINGDYYDTWDSGDEVPAYYWKEKS